MIEDDPETAHSLRRIASALGIAVERFYDRTTPSQIADTAECMRLWNRLKADDERTAVLNFIRAILDGKAP